MPLSELTPELAVYLLLLAALLGLTLGSFSACMAWRYASGEPLMRGRSHCDACGHLLTPKELVPVFSWLWQKGRCRKCGADIPARLPLTELLCAGAFVGLMHRFGISIFTAQYAILTVLLLLIGLIDYDTGLIPDGLLLAIVANWLAFAPFLREGFRHNVKTGLLGGLTASVPLLLLVLLMDRILKRESMGGGDIKFFFAAGLYFRWQSVLFLLIVSCLLGIVFTLVSQKTTDDSSNPNAFPFGPAIAAGVYISLMAAESVFRAYVGFFIN